MAAGTTVSLYVRATDGGIPARSAPNDAVMRVDAFSAELYLLEVVMDLAEAQGIHIKSHTMFIQTGHSQIAIYHIPYTI